MITNSVVLVENNGFMGDNFFAMSLAEQLHIQGNNKVFLKLRVASNAQYIALNPNIEGVLLDNGYVNNNLNTSNFTHIIIPSNLNYIDTPMVELQKPYVDSPVNDFIIPVDYSPNNKKIKIGYGLDWESRSFLFTEEEYRRGVDTPNLGYGGSHRDIDSILDLIIKNKDNIELIPIGKGANYNYKKDDYYTQMQQFDNMVNNLLQCNYFIGAEGGLSNLAYALRIPTILTSDFVHQLYGWNGVLKKVNNPKLGNIHYDDNLIHKEITPYATDEQVAEFITNNI